nr:(+)-neomenthol dehydrogenase-like isoform X2 [Ipomoea batatas]
MQQEGLRWPTNIDKQMSDRERFKYNVSIRAYNNQRGIYEVALESTSSSLGQPCYVKRDCPGILCAKSLLVRVAGDLNPLPDDEVQLTTMVTFLPPSGACRKAHEVSNVEVNFLMKWTLVVTVVDDDMPSMYAVVTGGNKGIGFEICRQLACEGVTVVLTARNEQKGAEAVEKLRGLGLSDNVLFHRLDVTDASTVSSLVHFVNTNFGRLDILNIPNEWAKGVLNNVESPPEKLDEVVNKFLEDLKNGSSKEKEWPPRMSAYIVSKAAMNAYARITAHKYPSLQVNCVDPGYVKTDINFNTGKITANEGAQNIVRVALQPEDGPSGLFFDCNKIVAF